MIRARPEAARDSARVHDRCGLRVGTLRLIEVTLLFVDHAEVVVRHTREEIIFRVGHVGDQRIARLVEFAILEVRAAEIEARELTGLAPGIIVRELLEVGLGQWVLLLIQLGDRIVESVAGDVIAMDLIVVNADCERSPRPVRSTPTRSPAAGYGRGIPAHWIRKSGTRRVA